MILEIFNEYSYKYRLQIGQKSVFVGEICSLKLLNAKKYTNDNSTLVVVFYD